jgi:hypothetical protein
MPPQLTTACLLLQPALLMHGVLPVTLLLPLSR